MNQNTSTERIFGIAIIVIASFTIGLVCCSGQEITTRDLLVGSADCSHVIQMIQRNGINQSCDRFKGDRLHHDPRLGSIVVPNDEIGDLRIISIHRIAEADSSCGPKFAVVIENASSRCVERFSVTAVATLGRIEPFSPSVTVQVSKIEPADALQVEFTLPMQATSMGTWNGKIVGFSRLVIAIDSFDELVETDEANNLRAYEMADITMAATASIPAAESGTQQSQPGKVSSNPEQTESSIASGHNDPDPLFSVVQTFATKTE